MINSILALAATASVTRAELVKAFDAVCLHDPRLERVDAKARQFGFHSVPVEPPTTENHETNAWERGPLRLFTLSGQKDPRWPLQPFCGVAADVGTLDNDKKLVRVIGSAAGAFFIEGRPAQKHSNYTLPLEDNSIVEVVVDRHDPKHVNVTLLLQTPPSTAAEK